MIMNLAHANKSCSWVDSKCWDRRVVMTIEPDVTNQSREGLVTSGSMVITTKSGKQKATKEARKIVEMKGKQIKDELS